jgi:hypothetical protein
MGTSLSLTESQTLKALRSFLIAILPSGIEVVQGQDNRTPEPRGPDFVVMTPTLRERLSTNVDSYVDTAFTGSIAGNQLIVTDVSLGALAVGRTLLGPNLVAGTTITAFGTGEGGIGTYTVSQLQTVPSQTLAAGVENILSPAKVTVQLDVHGPSSADNTAIITSLFRDEYAVNAFAASGFDVTPLFASDPHQMPFINGEQQIETRWVIDAVLQCNPVLTLPQDFAAQLSIDVIQV